MDAYCDTALEYEEAQHYTFLFLLTIATNLTSKQSSKQAG